MQVSTVPSTVFLNTGSQYYDTGKTIAYDEGDGYTPNHPYSQAVDKWNKLKKKLKDNAAASFLYIISSRAKVKFGKSQRADPWRIRQQFGLVKDAECFVNVIYIFKDVQASTAFENTMKLVVDDMKIPLRGREHVLRPYNTLDVYNADILEDDEGETTDIGHRHKVIKAFNKALKLWKQEDSTFRTRGMQRIAGRRLADYVSDRTLRYILRSSNKQPITSLHQLV